MDRILAHVVKLTRSIALYPIDADKRPSVQFFPGRPSSFMFAGGISLSWWFNTETYRAVAAISSLILETDPEFRDCDLETLKTIINNTIQEICCDARFFKTDDVMFRAQSNLFACKADIAVQDFASDILHEIKVRLRNAVGKRCTIYPLTRFLGPSFSIPELGLHAIARADTLGWGKLEEMGYLFDGWSPESPHMQNFDAAFPARLNFNYALVSAEYGTQKGTKFSSLLKLRVLIAIMFAIASEKSICTYHKAMAQPNTQCVQFPHSTCPDPRLVFSDCGALSPFYASDVPLDHSHILELTSWYGALARCTPQFKQRIEKASYFVNRGMNSGDIEAYINYFVALDALFGERGSVETSIARGINRLGLGIEMEKKSTWLFDLRNELVHGGSRFIEEWPKFHRYVRHYESSPLDDLKKLVQKAILKVTSWSD